MIKVMHGQVWLEESDGPIFKALPFIVCNDDDSKSGFSGMFAAGKHELTNSQLAAMEKGGRRYTMIRDAEPYIDGVYEELTGKVRR